MVAINYLSIISNQKTGPVPVQGPFPDELLSATSHPRIHQDIFEDSGQ
jgi:hypothetical protein